MSKFIPAIIAAVGMSTMAGCVAESGDMSEEYVSQDSQLACENREGTNAMLALLADAMARELGRWEITTDMEQFRGFNNQAMLRVKSTAVCVNGCAVTKWLLSYQDSRLDQKFVLADGTKLSSWSFASRLVTGFDNMKTCKTGGWCPYEAHKLTYQSSAPGPCDVLNTFGIQKPTGGNLSNVGNIRNALKFMEANGPNPYIAFAYTANSATIDPGLEGDQTGASGSTYGCTKYNPTGSLIGQGCVCASTPAVAGMPAPTLKRDPTLVPATPATLYCKY
jgi:hypothetical protein